MSSEPVRVACFDLGGVVIRICRSYADGCRAAGLDLRADDAAINAAFDRSHDLVEAHQTGRLPGPAYFERLSAALDGLYSPAEVGAIHRAWTQDHYDGVVDLIETLNAAGVVTAALSNTNAEHLEVIGDMPGMRAFRHVVASHLVGLHKPDPAIYRALESTVGASGPAIVFFDDLPANVAAARRLGWRAEAIDPLGDTAAQMTAALRGHGVGL